MNQKKILNEWFNTTNYVYNKTIELIKRGEFRALDFQGLRTHLVTSNTRTQHGDYDKLTKKIKDYEKEKNTNEKQKRLMKEMIKDVKNQLKRLPIEKNNGIYDWELNTPKDIRAGAVNDVCKAHKTGFSNLKAGNIKFFNMKYRKKNRPYKSFLLPNNAVTNKNGIINISPTFFKKQKVSSQFKMGKKTIKKYRDLEIKNDCRLLKQNNQYYLCIPIPMTISEKTKPVSYCGIDPGIRTFMTSFGNNGCYEYNYDMKKIKSVNTKIDTMKSVSKRIRKRAYCKMERNKEYLIDELHWKTITHMINNNDIIFYGDIKSHDIVKRNKNKTNNRDINNLKFFHFKERLRFKTFEKQKLMIEISEAYTSKTCSCCGHLNHPGSSKIYQCLNCNLICGRDINASKNMLMKGIIGC